MITNFEQITTELTQTELVYVPLLIQGFNTHSKSNPIKEIDIIINMNAYLANRNHEMRFTGAKLRKFVNYIRSNGLAPLIATSKGYYVSNDKTEIQKQINSLTERANSINRCAKGLQKLLNQ